MNSHTPDKKRMVWLSLFLIALFSTLIVQFFDIQILNGNTWQKIADRQHFFIISEPFKRGKFFSNSHVKKGDPANDRSFVVDVRKFHLFADPKSIPESFKNAISSELALILGLDTSDARLLKSNLEKESRSRKLAMWLDKNTYDAVLEWWHPYARKNRLPRNALFFVNDYQRSYPYGKLLGQVLHTIQKMKDEKTWQAMPTGGLELYFNEFLQGRQGKRRLMRSPRNALETGEVLCPPEDGADIFLTINAGLQSIAEEEIEKGVLNAKAKSGWAVMMDPYTGEILALAQYPSFNPADYQNYFNCLEKIEHTKVKAITDANEPGSIMKPITIAVALKANEELACRCEPPLFDPDAMMATSNPMFPGRKKPLRDTHFHSFLNMEMAIQKSSNIYCARLVEKIICRLGADWYHKVLCEDFGLGQRTGIELPSESPGLLPTPGKKYPSGILEWSASTPYSLAMGHNIQTNALQILRAYAIFANGGYLVKPTLVRKIVKTCPDGYVHVLLDNTCKDGDIRGRKVLSDEYVRRVSQAIKYTTKYGGTARRGDIWGYSEAGKTGTADKVKHGKYDPHFVCASFVGIAPANEPAFVLIVTIDEPAYGYVPGEGRTHMGGYCAAPVFREIGRRALEYLGIPPDDPCGYPPGDPRYRKDKADWLPEIRRLQEKYDSWNKSCHH